MPTLKVTSGPSSGQSWPVDGHIVIGREGVDVTIDDAEMSRRHAEVRPVAGGVEIEDLGSTNGTFVGGRKIEAPVTVGETTSIKLGTTQFELEVVPAASEQPIAEISDATKPRQVPDVTVPRAVPDPPEPAPPAPDLTAPRAVPTGQAPPAEAAPGTPASDVTAPRQIPGAPGTDVTAPRQVAGAPGHDVTAPRQIPTPDVTVARQVEGGQAPAPPGPGPGSAGPGGPPGGRPGGPPVQLIAIGLGVVVAILLLLLLLG